VRHLAAEQLKRFDEMQEEQLDEVIDGVERLRRRVDDTRD
jgi:hypothetical protein